LFFVIEGLFMKSIINITVWALATLFCAPSMARSSVPIVNYESVAITTGSGQAATPEQVKQAFIVGGAVKGWTFTVAGDGKLVANLVVRNKHTITADIAYSAGMYSVTYQGSTNMNYELKDGLPIIHPHYNKWVTNMLNEVRAQLAQL
jgi:ABC-type thiamine transport system substrate-binding protein